MTPDRTVASSQAPRARLAGVVYLLYFLTAIAAQTLTSRNFVAAGNAVNVVAYALCSASRLVTKRSRSFWRRNWCVRAAT